MNIFRKSLNNFQVPLKWDKNNVYFTGRRVYICDIISLSSFWSEMFQTKYVEKIKIRVLGSITFFPENRAVYEIMWKEYCRAAQATDDNMAQAHCMLDS
jgi:hypothetical protein